MATSDFSHLWMHGPALESQLEEDPCVPHEETDLHRVFCDETFCLEHGPRSSLDTN